MSGISLAEMGNRGSETCRLMPYVCLIIFFSCFTANSIVVDYVSKNQSLSGNQTMVSKHRIFELGFFKPGNSKYYYIGIWYRNISTQTVVWVANRDKPIKNPSTSELKISEGGSLVLLDHLKDEIWSTESDSYYFNSPVAILLDTGNLVVGDEPDSYATWQSFYYPTDTWLPGVEVTSDGYIFEAWRNFSDPAPGKFSFQINQNIDTEDPDVPIYTLDILPNTYHESNQRTGVCTRQILLNSVTGIEVYNYKGANESKYFTLSSPLAGFVIDYMGSIHQLTWSKPERKWLSSPAIQPYHQCEVKNPCGVMTSYNLQKPPQCTCLPGFKPRSTTHWGRNHWSGGCERTTNLSCDVNSSLPSGKSEFLKIPLKKLPPNAHSLANNKNAKHWRLVCLASCYCSAYAYYRSKYYMWVTDQWNLQQLSDEEPINGYMYLRLHLPEKGEERNTGAIVWVVGGLLVFLVIVLIFIWRYRGRHMIAASMSDENSLVVYKYRDLRKATKNFSEKLGGGSFGSVFKGALPNSIAIAVKRLEGFRQGDKQFRSEVSTIGIIHHVNLLRLLGFCSEGTKKLLVYDFMKYGSLDNHLFHQNGTAILDWKTRFQVAFGTARGLAYLHEECRECIIHCDIKPENILLDANFQPKVADFGMAKVLGREFSRVLTTMRGTIGYLAPEWISGSPITPKADVYSYGMMLLEIISGRRNTSKFEGENVHYFPVWAAAKLNEGEVLSLLDQRLNGNADLGELTRACRVACWCIQDDEADRPSMGKVVQILEGVVEVNIPPISRRLLNLVEAQEDTIAVLDSRSDQSTQLHTEYGSCEN